MENVSTRTWAVVGFLGLLVFFSYWMRFSIKHQGLNPFSIAFTYEMPRPQGFELAFDLSDREIESRYKTMKVDSTVLKGEEKKKSDPKAAAKEAEVKKTAAAKAAAEAARQAAFRRAGRMSVNTVDTSRDPQMSALEGDMAPSAAAPSWYNGSNAYAGAQKKTAVPADPNSIKKEEEDLGLSAAQWRALLQASPTSENVSKFVRAKQGGKLDATSYYEIVHELLTDSSADRVKAAFQVLDADVSAGTYVFVVTQLTAQSSGDQQVQLKRRLDAYSTPAQVSVLAEVMRSNKTPAVLQAATENLSTALSDYRKALELNSEAGSRNAGGFTAQQFTAFLPTLQSLAADPTSPIANQAQQLATEIQSVTQTT